MNSFENDPTARAAYSNNPSFQLGATERPDIEHLLRPEVAEAMDVLVEHVELFGKGGLRFDPLKATELSAHIANVTPLMEVTDSAPRSGFGARLETLTGFMTRGMVEYERKSKQRQSREEDRKQRKEMTEGLGAVLDYAAHILYHLPSRGRRLHELEVAYEKDPTCMIKAFAYADELIKANAEELAEVRAQGGELNFDPDEVMKELVDAYSEAFASFDLPSFSNPKFAELLEVVPVEYKATSPFNLSIEHAITPGSDVTFHTGRMGRILLSQFINKMQKTTSVDGALRLANDAYKFMYDHYDRPEATNAAGLIRAALTFDTIDLEKALAAQDVKNEALDDRRLFRYRSLLASGIARERSLNYPYFGLNTLIEMADLGDTVDLYHAVIRLVKAGAQKYGIHEKEIFNGLTSLDVIRFMGGFDTKDPEQLPIAMRCNERRYLKAWTAPRSDNVLTPYHNFDIVHLLENENAEASIIDHYSRYGNVGINYDLNHPGYWNTIARLVPGKLSPEQYAKTRDAIEDFKIETYVDGDYFVAPQGDQFRVSDPALRTAGFNSVTFKKLASDRKYIVATFDFHGAQVSTIISPEMELLDREMKPLVLLKERTEPLLYLIFGYLKALRCQTPDARSHNPSEDKHLGSDETFVRRAHMRRLPEGHRPNQQQIDFAFEREDFDVAKDNIQRAKKGLPIRTYVQQTIVDPENAKPTKYKAPNVEKALKAIIEE